MVKLLWIIGVVLLIGLIITTIPFLTNNHALSGTIAGDQTSPATVKTTNNSQSPMMYRADAARTGNYNPVSGGIVPKGQLKWKYKLDIYEPGPPIVWEDTVFLITPLNGTFAINATTGDLQWNNNEKGLGKSTSAPAAARGRVYLSPWNFFSLDAATGEVLWRYKGGNSFGSSPAISNGSVYIGNSDWDLYAFDAETGIVRWKYNTTIGSVKTVAVAEGKAYLTAIYINRTFSEGLDRSKDKIETYSRLYALDADTGKLNWRFTPIGNISYCGPVVADGILYLGTEYDNLYALDARTGEIRWNRTVNVSISSPAIDQGTLYVGSWDNSLYALDAKTGAQKWKYTVNESKYSGGITSSPSYADGVVYFGDMNGNLCALDAKTGVLRWRFSAGGFIGSSPSVSNGVVYVSAGDGYLYAIE